MSDASGTAADLVGTVAGQYRVLRRLGTGASGQVYEAQAVETGNSVALKVLHEHQRTEFGERFRREGKTLSLFAHPNIVELLEVGTLDNGALFLATELVRGVSMRDLLDEGYVDLHRALAIVRQVLEALAAAHAVGVIHRDIKPENIMLADGGRDDDTDLIKVLDFGVAKLVSDTAKVLGERTLTKTGYGGFGTPLYIAPEAVLGRVVDARADLYSVGVVLFELICGKPPFQSDDVTSLLRKHAAAPVPSLASSAPDRTITPQLELLVTEALAKRPEHRFRSAREMIAALDAAVQSLEIEAAIASSPVIAVPPVAPDLASASATQLDATPPLFPLPPVERPIRPVRAQSSPVERDRHAKRLRRYKLAAAGIGGVFVVLLIVLVASKSTRSAAASAVATRANELVQAGDAKQALTMVDDELATRPNDARLHLARGHALFASSRQLAALGAYERAIALAPSLASDADIRANARAVVAGKDVLASVVALELLATHVSPPDRDAIGEVAATTKLVDVRRRALAIAERDGFAERVDRVASWSLDLAQAKTCDDRRSAIEKLAGSADLRAIAVLERAKAHKCVQRDATEAIARIESAK